MTLTTEPGRPPRRADARRNHERVLAAAVEVFTEHGLEATVPEIAARAGVGKATVYRSYPTKADLVRAIAQRHIDWLNGLVAEAAGRASDDAAGALGDLLQRVTTTIAQDRLMVDVLSTIDDLDDEATFDALEEILAHGRAQGTLRQDASVLDVKVLVAGFARSLVDLGVTDLDVWRRYTTLVVAALRP
ncbi:TetR/AcrR family transcriptional regulator [Luteimicrobium subarcticum]|uniref:TetR family transcriptional regulator n=1 Tax=Luteimicrobium subarcticum TaxID=620910 RepID=A0A2M8W6X0_9MICO|nr:TetR/AcrR family transcriptional regulator [Luteimicrobium subarcticum]PJI86659.1 TetR family transcriptional regulator [Luteimicrobium subarcticum]